MGSTLMGGAAGAFVGSKLGLGKLGGAAAVSVLSFIVRGDVVLMMAV